MDIGPIDSAAVDRAVNDLDDRNSGSGSDVPFFFDFEGYTSGSSLSDPPSVIHTPEYECDFKALDYGVTNDLNGIFVQQNMMDLDWPEAHVGQIDGVHADQQVKGYQFNDFDRPYPRLASSVDDNHELSMHLARVRTYTANGSVSTRFASAPARIVPFRGSPGPDFRLITGGPGTHSLGTANMSSSESTWSAGIYSPSGSSWSSGIQESQVPENLDELQVSDSLDQPQAPASLDPRIRPEALTFDNGAWKIPRGCHWCLSLKQFCDRGSPCSRCANSGRRCTRSEGFQTAGQKQKRKKSLKKVPRPSPQVSRKRLLETKNDEKAPRKKGRPKAIKLEATETVKAKLVKAIEIVDPQQGKPAGIGHPMVWCEVCDIPGMGKSLAVQSSNEKLQTRQELCEGLPYYRAFQSGCYTHDGLVHGYLLDACDSTRDYVGGKVVISHSGGKSKEDEGTGLRSLIMNQTTKDTTIKCLLNNLKLKFPIAIIIGNRSTMSPSRIPHRYCAMDWFKVTHAWAEKDPLSGFSRWKFRFEKLDFTSDGWWAVEKTDTPGDAEIVIASCKACRKESPHIYQQGWMCLNPACSDFWKIDGSGAPNELTYTTEFLNSNTPWESALEVPPSPLRPQTNLEWDDMFDAQDVSRKAWKGFCCSNCGRLSCREHWDRWECANESCGLKLYPKKRPVFQAAQLADPHRPLYTGPAISQDVFGDEIQCTRSVIDGFTVLQYELGNCGTVTHMLANQATNARSLDADWLLEKYQEANLPFKRYKLHTQQGVTRTSHFTYNVGAQYNYVADQPTVTFEEASPVVRRALELIKQRVGMIYPNVAFNEVLNVGYFESQRMNYHQDGERGLGPTVASISLGCPAVMKFRIKGSGRNTVRHIEDDADDEENLMPLKKEPAVRLTLRLHHGDIMIMHGATIQSVWEHAAQPLGLFRIAATARWIGEENHLTKAKVKTEVKVETEVEIEAETPFGPEIQAGPMIQAEPEVQTEPTVQVHPETQFEQMIQAEPKVQPEIQFERMIQAESAVQTEPMVQVQPEIQFEQMIQAEPAVQTEPMVQVQPEIQFEQMIQAESAVQTEPMVQVQPEIQFEQMIQAEPKVQPEIQFERMIQAESAVQTEPMVQVKPEIQFEQMVQVEPRIKIEPEEDF
ncbi:hypothetical protein BDD12DRAFT_874882 [Trichophaea hybrida]|nr:hypothetical protein BDD12DRAFT_874882 [Trichophaea hybrida]